MTSTDQPSTASATDGRPSASVRFTEEMKGYVSFGEEDYERGYEQGRLSGMHLMFHLTIEAEGIESFIADPRHEAPARGWVRCEELGGKLEVERGIFNLFVDTDRAGEKRMLYRLHFADGVGHPLTLSGFKVIPNGPGFSLWPDTTTLYTRILRGHTGPDEDDDAELIASGILRISTRDFMRQLTTFRGSGQSAGESLRALARFNAFFAGELRRAYAPPRKRRAAHG